MTTSDPRYQARLILEEYQPLCQILLGEREYEPLTDEHYDDKDGWLDVVAVAKKDPVGWTHLARQVVAMSRHSEPLPHPIADMVAELMLGLVTPPKGRGRPASVQKQARDLLIWKAMQKLVGMGLKPTRNPASEGPSAASIVRDVFAELDDSLSEATVQNVWLQGKARRVPDK